MGRCVVVFGFDDPDDGITLKEVFNRAKGLFIEFPNVKGYFGIDELADIVENLVGNNSEDPGTSPHVDHARRELELLGQTEEDPEFARAIVGAVQAFFSYGHSGGSFGPGASMLMRLLEGKNLGPLTDNPKEWMNVEMGDDPCWQNIRNGEAFSHDEGKTYYLLSEGGNSQNREPLHESEKSA